MYQTYASLKRKNPTSNVANIDSRPKGPSPIKQIPLPYRKPLPNPMQSMPQAPAGQMPHNTGVAGGMGIPNTQIPQSPLAELQRRYAELRALGY